MPPRWCKKCKVVFDSEVCAAGHAIFMYTKKIPSAAEPLQQERRNTAQAQHQEAVHTAEEAHLDRELAIVERELEQTHFEAVQTGGGAVGKIRRRPYHAQYWRIDD